MAEFRKNKKTGEIEAFKNGKKIGKIITMEDKMQEIIKINKQRKKG